MVDRLSDTVQNSLINTVTIFLGLGVGSKMSADKFLNFETMGILGLGAVAFCIGTASGVLMAKIMNLFSANKINPLIGAAGVSAVPMAARGGKSSRATREPTKFPSNACDGSQCGWCNWISGGCWCHDQSCWISNHERAR